MQTSNNNIAGKAYAEKFNELTNGWVPPLLTSLLSSPDFVKLQSDIENTVPFLKLGMPADVYYIAVGVNKSEPITWGIAHKLINYVLTNHTAFEICDTEDISFYRLLINTYMEIEEGIAKFQQQAYEYAERKNQARNSIVKPFPTA